MHVKAHSIQSVQTHDTFGTSIYICGMLRFSRMIEGCDLLQVEIERKKMSRRAAIVGTMGILVPLVQNELIYQNFHPQHVVVEVFKVLNTVSTAVLLFWIFKIYHMKVLFNR